MYSAMDRRSIAIAKGFLGHADDTASAMVAGVTRGVVSGYLPSNSVGLLAERATADFAVSAYSGNSWEVVASAAGCLGEIYGEYIVDRVIKHSGIDVGADAASLLGAAGAVLQPGQFVADFFNRQMTNFFAGLPPIRPPTLPRTMESTAPAIAGFTMTPAWGVVNPAIAGSADPAWGIVNPAIAGETPSYPILPPPPNLGDPPPIIQKPPPYQPGQPHQPTKPPTGGTAPTKPPTTGPPSSLPPPPPEHGPPVFG